MAEYFATISVGVFITILFCFFFIRMDGKWQRFVLNGVGLGVFATAFAFVKSNINSDSYDSSWLLTVYFFSIIISLIIFLILFSCILKSQQAKEKISIRIMDIFIGFKPSIEKYYKQRYLDIDNELNIDMLKIKCKEADNAISMDALSVLGPNGTSGYYLVQNNDNTHLSTDGVVWATGMVAGEIARINLPLKNYKMGK